MSAFDQMGFAGNPLDRMSNLRDDALALADCANDPGARAVVFAQAMPVLRPNGAGLSALHRLSAARDFGCVREEILLGRDAAGPVFALLLPDDCAQAEESAPEGAFVDQRRVALRGRPDLPIHDLRRLGMEDALDRAQIAILAQAKAALHFHASHRFCARCGAETSAEQGGWRRDCAACGARHFPRTDPVVIVQVTHGDDCLLGRQKHFPPGMYSCLAGFVEGGETLQEAARREIMEESGVTLGEVEILASQPWPFPASLMIGCRASALSREIVMDAIELEDCRWFSRLEVRAMIEGWHPQALLAPKPIAIARRLLDHWLAGGDN
jgi:NAD+ diphosphatase